jgi:ferredoxin
MLPRFLNVAGRGFEVISAFTDCLLDAFGDPSLFGFSSIEERLAEQTGCKCALVTLVTHPDLNYHYNPVEFYHMATELGEAQSAKMRLVKNFLDEKGIRYASPPAAPKNDGSYFAEFSYKWAAIHAGLGFIGKNDVFVHYQYAQRVRISCLLLDLSVPCYAGGIQSKCSSCDACVQACPHGLLTGETWNIAAKREDLVDYKSCARNSRHDGSGQKYLCAHCSLACRYPLCE